VNQVKHNTPPAQPPKEEAEERQYVRIIEPKTNLTISNSTSKRGSSNNDEANEYAKVIPFRNTLTLETKPNSSNNNNDEADEYAKIILRKTTKPVYDNLPPQDNGHEYG